MSPGPVPVPLPALLDDAPIVVLGYPKAMVVAEKLVTALQRGRANTRWRDFADLYLLIEGRMIDDQSVLTAVRTVASHRGVKLAPLGEVLRGLDEEGQQRWSRWRRQHQAAGDVPEFLSDILGALDKSTRAWLSPI